MSILYISEHESLASTVDGVVTAVPMPSTTDQTVDFSGGADSSDAFASETTFVQVVADAACHIAFGDDPTATTDNFLLPANVPRIYGVRGGQKVSAIATS